jgi:hypothetical protein
MLSSLTTATTPVFAERLAGTGAVDRSFECGCNTSYDVVFFLDQRKLAPPNTTFTTDERIV